jgi:hypothetical protein
LPWIVNRFYVVLLADSDGETDVDADVDVVVDVVTDGDTLTPVDGITDTDVLGATDGMTLFTVLGKIDVAGAVVVPLPLGVHPAKAAASTIITIIVAISFFIKSPPLNLFLPIGRRFIKVYFT